MASHFKWYPDSSETVVPWNARYSFPSQANKAEKITPRIPPKSGSQFNPGQVIRVEFPAQGYVNPANTFLEFDVTLQGYQGTGTEPVPDAATGNPLGTVNSQVVRFQNNIQSIFQRVRLLYGATPLEDIIDYNVIVRELTEWTSGGSTLDQNSIREGIGGVVTSQCNTNIINASSGDSFASRPVPGLANVRQAFVQGIDTRINLSAAIASDGPLPTNYPIIGDDVTQPYGQGWGVVPNQQSGQSNLSGDTYTGQVGSKNIQFKTVCTRRYQVQFALGLFTQDKLIPAKYMASQLAIELTLAPEADCIFVQKAPTTSTANPTYQVTNVNLIPEILQFDSSYDAMFLRGLREGGVPIKFSSWHTFSSPATSTNMQMLIQERSRSVKALFAVQRTGTASFVEDSHACLFDSCTTTDGTTAAASTLQSFQYRIGGR